MKNVLLGLVTALMFLGCGQETLNVGTSSLQTSSPEPLCEVKCGCRQDKSLICHYPPGNEGNPQTICVGSRLIPDHLEHGDACGECGPQEPECGDEVCEAPENCSSCEVDCGECPPVCGDKVCEGDEDCGSCERDCGECPPVCGDQLCERGESCSDCPSDCDECPPECGDEVCEDGESCFDCPSDCGVCPPECGDGICESGENCEECPADCGVCPPVCGDGECDTRENCSQCSQDCGQCPIEEPKPEPPAVPESEISGGKLGGCSTSGTDGGYLFMLFVLGTFFMLRRKQYKSFLALVLLTGIAFAPNIAAAQAPAGDPANVELERFDMPMDSSSIINVEGADVGPQKSWGLNLWLGYANDPLVVNQRLPGESWQRQGALVGDQVSASIGGYYVVAPRLAVGLALPLTLYQGRDSGQLSGLSHLSASGFGDARVLAKLQILDQEDYPLDLAFGANWSLPTASSNGYLGEPNPTFSPYLAAARWAGSWRFAANLGVTIRDSQKIADLQVSEEVFARLGVAYGWGVNEVAITGATRTRATELFEDNSSYAEVMAGYTRYFGPGWSAFAAAGTGANEGFGAPDFRLMAGLRYEFEGDHPTPTCGPLGGTDCPEKCCEEPKPEPKPEPEPEPEPKKLVITLDDVFFKFDESTLIGNYQTKISWAADEIREALKTEKDILVVIEGHTDSIGTNEYNLELGERRVLAVGRALMEAGVPAEVLRGTTFGESRPRATNSTTEGRAANRRVEIYLVGVDDIDVVYPKNPPVKATRDGFGKLRRK